MKLATLILLLVPSLALSAPENRVASIFVSQDFINEQLTAHAKSDLVKEMKIVLDSDHGLFFLRGKIQIPVEELRAINLDPTLGAFRFQLTIKPETTKRGHLILEFPLEETYFYPAASRDPAHERVVIPVQLLSLGLASMRGYMAALSGDFSGFDRRTTKLTALMKGLDRSILVEKNPDALEELKTQRESLRLQLAAVPIERKQLQSAAKEVEHLLGFTGEKELNINDDLGARKNALILKIKLSQLTPYLNGVDLAGIRILHDKADGGGEHYLAVDVDSQLVSSAQAGLLSKPLPRAMVGDQASLAVTKSPPALIIRLNQALFESSAIVHAEKQQMGTNLRDLKITLMDDGLHIAGSWHTFFFFSIPFDTAVDFVSTGVDVFEVRVRQLDIAGIDLEFLTSFVLEMLKKRLDTTLKGICTFKYLGVEKDHARALQVTVSPKALVPAFPDLHLVDVDVREREFLLKIGRP